MPFNILKGDITKLQVDAVVNAANESLLGGGGVDGAIHYAAGPELLKECRTLGGCKTGQAKITKGYNMPCKYIIHTPGPVWHGGDRNEEQLLYSCYHESLLLAKMNNCESIAFPLISSGVFGYPKDKALEVAENAIRDFLDENDMDVTMVIYKVSDLVLDFNIKKRISGCIAEKFEKNKNNFLGLGAQSQYSTPMLNSAPKKFPGKFFDSSFKEKRSFEKKKSDEQCFEADESISFACEEISAEFKVLDFSFSQTLLDIIDKKGLKDSEVYKKANIDRRLFSKIRSDINYRPKKQTAVAFAIALELDLEQTLDLLSKAGFILSDSILFDVIIKHYIETQNYDIFEINNVLFSYDQTLIGA